LHLQSRRIMHEPLDDEEFAAGVSDIRGDSCESLVYDVEGGRFTRSKQSSNRGACDASGSP